MANRNFANSRIYTGHVMPVMLDVSIPIGGTGAVGTISGPYIRSVTRLAAGTYQIQMQDNYSGYYFGGSQIISPTTGSDLSIRAADTALSIGSTYVITVLGGATAANWLALGVPQGVTPAVGVPFVALATGAGTNSVSKVKLLGDSGISKIELCGNPNLEIAPIYQNNSQGAIVLLKCKAPLITMGAYTPAGTVAAPVLTMNSYTPAGTNDGSTPPIFTGAPATLTGTNSAPAFTGTAASLTGTIAYSAADPASGSVLKLFFVLSNSSVQINGE